MTAIHTEFRQPVEPVKRYISVAVWWVKSKSEPNEQVAEVVYPLVNGHPDWNEGTFHILAYPEKFNEKVISKIRESRIFEVSLSPMGLFLL